MTSGLTVRQHERESVELAVEFVVCDEHREQVRFSPSSAAAEPHVTRGLATDLSSGGLGMICGQFVPRMCEGSIRVFDPTPVGTGADGLPIHEVAFEHRVKVRRVVLEDHEPQYAVGMAFIDPEPNMEERVTKILALVEVARGQISGESGDGHA